MQKAAKIAAVLGIIALVAIGNACGSAESAQSQAQQEQPTASAELKEETTAAPEPTPEPTVEPTAQTTSEPTADPTAQPTPEPTPEPEPVIVSGSGETATDVINIPFLLAVLSIRHSGDGYFGIEAYQGDDSELLVNEVGAYSGKKWLLAGEYVFDIDADGAWEIVIAPMAIQPSVAQDGFSGKGDEISGLFDPPGTQAWEVSHTGDGYFGILAVCAGGNELIANEVGKFVGSGVVRFPKGPCFFEVSANGEFSIKPR